MAVCAWCKASMDPKRIHQRFCSTKCRQWAFRLRQRIDELAQGARPLRFAYADPPYPGTAARYYKGEASFGGEVDHRALIAQLERGGYAGWALSTSVKALRAVLPLCPEGAHVSAWVKPIGARARTFGPHNTWEPLIVVGGRARRPGVRDWLSAQPARGGGTLPGRKPLAFCAFLFEQLGMLPGDALDDLFPGTGIVTKAWAELSRTPGSRDHEDSA